MDIFAKWLQTSCMCGLCWPLACSSQAASYVVSGREGNSATVSKVCVSTGLRKLLLQLGKVAFACRCKEHDSCIVIFISGCLCFLCLQCLTWFSQNLTAMRTERERERERERQTERKRDRLRVRIERDTVCEDVPYTNTQTKYWSSTWSTAEST